MITMDTTDKSLLWVNGEKQATTPSGEIVDAPKVEEKQPPLKTVDENMAELESPPKDVEGNPKTIADTEPKDGRE
jgi:hypothetical protein